MRYLNSLSKILEFTGATEGSRISITNDNITYVGTLMPHHEFSQPDILILKMDNGYNVGIRINECSQIKVLCKPIKRIKKEIKIDIKPNLPKITLIGTGGTIASYIDYRTGAVHPNFSASNMINSIPEIMDIANINAKSLFSILSENMNIEHWQKLADAVAYEINSGADGVIIPHGTDTMGYTAAALSFMLIGVPKPVVLVGAQRSADRPSSDASSNLIACTHFCAEAGLAGIFVVMHDTLNDDSFAAHIGSRVRKMHTSRRDAFHSINSSPAAHIDKNGKISLNITCPKVFNSKITAKTKMERSCVLLQYYPGMDPMLFEDVFMKSKGIVISGSGLGHVNRNIIPLIKKACDNGSIVVSTSQCLGGMTNLNIYDTGRDMLKSGVITVQDMLPETAYIKLMWVLANTSSIEDAKNMMQISLVGEMSNRRTVYE